MKTKLKELKEKWADELLEVLWAYRTTVRTLTGKTLFSLTYGSESMIQVEIGASSLRRENYDSEQNFILHKRELNFLEEKWCDSKLQVADYQRCIARYFNSKVKPMRF